MFGNDLATLPNFPAEIRAPQGTLPGVSSFQIHLADHDILTPGDAPDVLVAMNPAALKVNLPDLKRGGTIIVDSHDFTDRSLAKAGYDKNPLEDGSLDDYIVHAVDLTTRHGGVRRGVRPEAQGRRRGRRTCSRSGWCRGCTAATSTPRPRSSRAGSPSPRSCATRTSPRSPPATTSARPPRRSACSSRSARRRWRPARTAASPATWPWRTGSSPRASRPACRCSSAATRSRRRRTSCTSSASTRSSASPRSRPRTRSPASAPPWVPRSAARSASRRRPGPGISLKSETIGLGVMLELPLLVIDVQRGGPSTGLPTKTEQADLLQAMFGRNGEAPLPIIAPAVAGRLLRRRAGGRPHRDHLPDAGHPAVRRLPRERLGAVAAPGRRRARADRPRLRDAERGRAVPAVPARRVDARAAVGDPGRRGPGAPHRRAREGRRHRRHLLRPGQPRRDGAAAAGQDRPHRRRHRAHRGRRPGRRRPRARHRVGLELRARSARPARGCAGRGIPVAHAHLRHLNPFPPDLGAILERYDRVLVPEMNLGQLRMLLRAKLPRRRRGPQPRARHAAAGRRT